MARRPQRSRPALPLFAVLAAFAFGLFLRYYRLSSIPPLLWYDEAWFANRARDMLETGVLPVYFPTPGGGVHPMLVYLTAGLAALFGITPISSRIATALAGALAIPLLYLAAKDLLANSAGDERRARWLAALAALLQAALFWNVFLSRLGTEPILVPLLGVPALHLFYLGIRNVSPSGVEASAGTPEPAKASTPISQSPNLQSPISRFPNLQSPVSNLQLIYLTSAGILLGLALYTSPNARFLPVTFIIIALAIAAVAALDRKRWRTPLLGLLLAGVVSAVVFAPFGFYILQNAEALFGRARTVTYATFGPGAESIPLAVLRNLGNTLWGISVKGDTFSRHNLPGRPNLDPILSLFFWSGLVIALRRARRDPSMILITGWAAGMTLPTVLSDGAPIFTRSLAAAPAMILLIVVGLNATHNWLAMRIKPRRSGALLGLLLSLSLSLNVYDYFVRFPNHPATFDGFTAGEYQAARAARTLAAADAVYLTPWTATDDYPNFELLLKDTPARGFDSARCLPFQPGRTNHYLVNVLADPDGLDRLTARFPQGAVSGIILHQPEPFPLTEIFTLPPNAAPAISIPLNVRFGPDIILLGADISSPRPPFGETPPVSPSSFPLPASFPRPGETFTVTLAWKALAPVEADLVAFLHLAPDAASPPVAQHDSAPCSATYQTYLWREGEAVFDPHPLALPDDLAPGRYTLFAGLYTWPDQSRLPVRAGEIETDRLELAEIEVLP